MCQESDLFDFHRAEGLRSSNWGPRQIIAKKSTKNWFIKELELR